MKQLHVWVAPAVLAAALLTLTACGGSDKKTGSGATTSSTSAAQTAVPQSSSTAATTPLSAIVLKQSDVPSTFTKSTPDPDDPNDAAEQAKIAACVGVKDNTADKLDTAKSEFKQGDNDISSNASRFKSDSDIASDVKMLHSPKIDSCIEQSARRTIAKDVPAGAKLEDLSVHVTPGSNGGPSNVEAIAKATITLSANAQSVKIYVMTAYITGPRIEAEVDLTGVGAPIPDAVTQAAVKAVADRAAKG